MNSTTQARSKGHAALAAFALVLISGTWIMGGTANSILPGRASSFLAVLNTERVAGERVGIWERLTAGFTLAARHPARTCPRS